jgi:hypothetical protein
VYGILEAMAAVDEPEMAATVVSQVKIGCGVWQVPALTYL